MPSSRTLLALLLIPILSSLPAAAEKRVALVIGNSNYSQVGTLPNPVNDANDISAALKRGGFEVILGVDVDKREFDTKVRNFADLLENADVLRRARAAGVGPQLSAARRCPRAE